MSTPDRPVHPAVVAPSREDPVVRRLSEVLGGPVGRHARPGMAPGVPERVVVALAALAGLAAWAAKWPCRAEGWAPPGQYVHLCYSDIPLLFGGRGLADGVVPYLTRLPSADYLEYPVLTGLVMGVTAWLVPGTGYTVERMVAYYDLNAVLLAGCLVATVLATARTVRHRPWDAAMVALAPGTVLAATINWDLYAVALTALALLAWSRDRAALAGVALGLAVAAKFYPLLLLGPLLLLCLRAGRLPRFAVALGGAAGAWLAVNLPVLVLNPEGWARFYAFSRERGVSWSSVWLLVDHVEARAGVELLTADRVNVVAVLALAACCAGIGGLALAAPRRPRLASLAFLVVAAFVLTNKVYSPQFVLWLIPLAALARPRWRDLLVWQATQAVHFAAVWLHLLGVTDPDRADRALPQHAYDLAVLLHIAGTLWFVGLVVRDVLRPEHDPVRAGGYDDPGGGPLDGAPDARVLPAVR